MRGSRLRERARDPRFLTDSDDTATAATLYTHTYDAIHGADGVRGHRGRRARRRLVPAAIAVALAVAAALLAGRVDRGDVAAAVNRLRAAVGAALPAPAARPPSRAAPEAVRAPDAAPAPAPPAAADPDAAPAVPATTPAPGADAPVIVASAPPVAKKTVRVGESEDFALVVLGYDLRYAWSIDGRAAGTGPRWSFVPTLDDVGVHRIEATARGTGGAAHERWVVRVRPPRAPRVRLATPASAAVEATAGEPVALRVDAEPAQPGEAVRIAWALDGTRAADGPRFTFRPAAPGRFTVRADVAGALGGVTSRTWEVEVRPPAAASPPPVQTVARETPAPAAERVPPSPASPLGRTPAVAAPRAPQVAARRRGGREPPPPTGRNARQEDVVRWLDRYAAAWRTRDVDTLRRLGQVASDRDAAALRTYFASVRELDVDIDLLAVHTAGETAVVRFTRRDRFRDPAGRLVLKESPPIEKVLRWTPEGLRIVASRH